MDSFQCNPARPPQQSAPSAFTLVEMMLSIGLSSIVLLSVASMIPVYDRVGFMTNDQGLLMQEADHVYNQVQKWLKSSKRLLAVTPLEDQNIQNGSELTTSVHIFAWMGDRTQPPGRAEDKSIQKDEIQDLHFYRMWKPSRVGSRGVGGNEYYGNLHVHYYESVDSTDIDALLTDDNDVNHNWLSNPLNWTADARKNISWRVSEFEAGFRQDRQLCCINVDMLNFARIVPSEEIEQQPTYVPPRYSFEIVGTPGGLMAP